MMKLSWRILRPILLLIICVVAGLFIYDRFFRQPPKPEVTTEELQMKVTQRLRLITEEISYRKDINLYEAGQHAVGTADLVAYVKYDLEKLHFSTVGDTIYVSLPAPELEIGRLPGGHHSVRYYLDRGGRLGEASADRVAIHRFDERILHDAEQEIRTSERYLPEAQQRAEAQLQRLLSALAPHRALLVVPEVHLPQGELPASISTSIPYDQRQ